MAVTTKALLAALTTRGFQQTKKKIEITKKKKSILPPSFCTGRLQPPRLFFTKKGTKKRTGDKKMLIYHLLLIHAYDILFFLEGGLNA